MWFDTPTTAFYSPSEQRPRRQVGSRLKASDDLSVYPGQNLSPKMRAREEKREILKETIRRLRTEGFSWSCEQTHRISAETATAAIRFFELAPLNVVTPQIGPDGEGGLTVRWEMLGDVVIVLIDGARLHAVNHAGTDRAEYIDDLPFERWEIPSEISAILPIG